MSLTMAIVFLIIGCALMILGGEILVRGAVRLAALFGIPPLIVGLTVVAVCTSAPELAVSLTGIFSDSKAGADIALGNVVGSSSFNILFILGLTALCAPLSVSSSLIKKEIPILIAISALTWLFSLAGGGSPVFPRWGGIVFICLIIAYLTWVVLSIHSDGGKYAQEVEASVKTGGGGIFQRAILSTVLIAAGLALLVFGSGRCVEGAVAIAQYCHVSELTISLTVLAAGTSLPELVVSIIAAVRKQTDIAVGNVIGSNIFNLLGILGLSAICAGDLPVSRQAFIFDIPVMFAATVVTALFCVTGFRLCRKEGAVLLTGYIAYVVALLTVFGGK